MEDKEINPEMEKELCTSDCECLNKELSACYLYDEELHKHHRLDRYLRLFSCQFNELQKENRRLRKMLEEKKK